MAIEQELYNYLSGYSALTALVNDRIYPVKAPQGAETPYCLYAKAEDMRQYSHNGFSGLSKVVLVLSGLSSTYNSAIQVAQQLVDAMEGWPDEASDVSAAMKQKEEDLYDEDAGLYRVQVEYLIWYVS